MPKYSLNTFKIIGLGFITLAIALLVLGVSTLFWPETEGELISRSIARQYAGAYPGIEKPQPLFHRSSHIDWIKVGYRYQVNTTWFEAKLLCVCLPFALPAPDLVDGRIVSVPVRYLSFFPGVAVLVAGPDWRLVVFLLLIGLSFLYIRRALLRNLVKTGAAQVCPEKR